MVSFCKKQIVAEFWGPRHRHDESKDLVSDASTEPRKCGRCNFRVRANVRDYKLHAEYLEKLAEAVGGKLEANWLRLMTPVSRTSRYQPYLSVYAKVYLRLGAGLSRMTVVSDDYYCEDIAGHDPS